MTTWSTRWKGCYHATTATAMRTALAGTAPTTCSRPRGRSVDSNPSWAAVRCTQGSEPYGVPRCTPEVGVDAVLGEGPPVGRKEPGQRLREPGDRHIGDATMGGESPGARGGRREQEQRGR